MLFLGMANAYVMRTNMSVAIVAMVNHTHNSLNAADVVDDECPEYNGTSGVSIINHCNTIFDRSIDIKLISSIKRIHFIRSCQL